MKHISTVKGFMGWSRTLFINYPYVLQILCHLLCSLDLFSEPENTCTYPFLTVSLPSYHWMNMPCQGTITKTTQQCPPLYHCYNMQHYNMAPQQHHTWKNTTCLHQASTLYSKMFADSSGMRGHYLHYVDTVFCTFEYIYSHTTYAQVKVIYHIWSHFLEFTSCDQTWGTPNCRTLPLLWPHLCSCLLLHSTTALYE